MNKKWIEKLPGGSIEVVVEVIVVVGEVNNVAVDSKIIRSFIDISKIFELNIFQF